MSAPRESHLLELIEGGPDAVLIAEPEGRLVYVNAAACRLFGYGRDELLGKSLEDLVPADELERLRAGMLRLVEHTILVEEGTVHRKDGSRVQVEVSARLGEGGVWQALVRDISRRKHIEAELRASEARLRAFLTAMPDLLFRLDRRGRFIDVSAAEPSRLALPAAVLVGRSVAEVFEDEHRPKVGEFIEPAAFGRQLRQALERAFTTGQVQRFEYQYGRDWFEARLVCSGPDEVLALARDISELKSAEAASRLSQERLSLALDAAGVGLWDWDVVADEAYLSPQYLRLLGYDAAELGRVDRAFFDALVHPSDRAQVRRVMQEHLQGASERSSIEYRARKRSGEYVWFRGIGQVVERDPSGAPRRMVGIIIDITAARSREEALASAILARENILALVSHDLRTPLSTIALTAQTALRSAPESDRRASGKQLQRIIGAADRMTRLIDDLLRAATIDAGVFTVEARPHEVWPMLEAAMRGLEAAAASKSVRLECTAPRPLPPVWADEARVVQVLDNLLSNALKVSPPGSLIELRAEAGRGEVLFSIADRGPGIAEESLPRLFERFYSKQVNREAGEGIGLGLFIAQGIVRAHGGKLWAESKVGVGSTFHFTIPMAPREERSPRPGGEAAHP